jgi:hypothetical protein
MVNWPCGTARSDVTSALISINPNGQRHDPRVALRAAGHPQALVCGRVHVSVYIGFWFLTWTFVLRRQCVVDGA